MRKLHATPKAASKARACGVGPLNKVSGTVSPCAGQVHDRQGLDGRKPCQFLVNRNVSSCGPPEAADIEGMGRGEWRPGDFSPISAARFRAVGPGGPFAVMAGSWALYGFGNFSVLDKATGQVAWAGRTLASGPLAWAGDRMGSSALRLGPWLCHRSCSCGDGLGCCDAWLDAHGACHPSRK